MNEIYRAERVQRLSPAKRALLLNAAREKMLRAQREHAITRRAQNGPATLSYAQQGLWFFEQLEPGSSVFNTPVTVRFEGKLNLPALQDSLREISRRHEILHTIFVVVDNEPAQSVLPDFNVQLPIVDLESLSEAERDIAFRLIDREVNRPFNLSQDPLLRVTILQLDREQYILPLTLHHLVGDAWSRGILVEELKALYKAFSNGLPSPLSELPIQYADYAEWQREWLTGEILDQQLGYWKQQLDAASEPVELPTDHPRPPVQTYHGAKESFSLLRNELESLKTMSQREGVTPFMTLLAAFNTLLYRYTGQRDISLGTPAANRNRIEVERLIGLFANVLVLRTDLSGDSTFRELLLRVRRVALDAYTNQDLPFEKLVVELQPERSLSHHPLFQIMFVFENARMEALELPGLVMSRIQNQSNTAHFELQIILTETGMGLAGAVEYNGDLFEAATIKRLVRHYERVLAAVVRDPAQELWQLPLLSEAEQHQLLVAWNQTDSGTSLGHCLHELFEQEVEQGPERVAVVFGEQQLSYGELNRRANQLAHHLRRFGVGPEVLVGLCLERSVELVVGLLGILKAGGAYVPLDPAYPEQRLAFMVADAHVPVLLTNDQEQQQSLWWVSELTTVVQVDLSRDWTQISRESEQQPHSQVSSENAAYVIYTSGSTGRPKGVVLRHGGAVELMEWAKERFGRESLAAVLASTSICFDLSVFELFAPLSCGGRVVLIESVLRLAEGSRLPEVTLVNTVPSAAAMLLRAGALPASASVVNVAGEPLARELVEALYATGSVKQVHNLYGPTEDTTYSTGAVIAAGSSEQPGIGRPLLGRQSYVLDQQMQAVGIGVRGELYLGGRGLARGYWNRPELTADKFVPHPFSETGGERLYRTGDQGRHLGDGQLAFFGRVDHQVKLRGYRIELGEIEAVLRSASEVQNAVVVVQEVEQRLVGYVVRAAGSERLTMNQWRSRLSAQLPEYMIPSVMVELQEWPLLPNGKLDRRALPEPEGTLVVSGERQTARTLVEELVANIWAEVLRVDQVGVNENFFELGGHSLLAAQVAARVQQVLGVQMPLRWMFEAPTVGGLATRLEGEQRAEVKPMKSREECEALPLSFAQERLWFLEQLAPGRATYNIASGVEVRGVLQLAALTQSLGEVVRRHEVLRTSFTSVAGQPLQLIVDEATLAVELVDLQGLVGEEQQAVARRLAGEEAQRPFELAQGPLLRVRLLQLGEQQHQVLFIMHHIVSDGWSLGVLVREVVSLYEALVQGRPSPLAELALQYGDYAVWQREWLQGEVLAGQVDYWKQQLAGAPEVTTLPLDHARPPQQSFRGGSEEIGFGSELTAELERLSRHEGVTVFMTLVGAFAGLLYRYTGQGDLLLGTTVAGRNRLEVEPLLGFFVNTLVLRTEVAGRLEFSKLLAQVREVSLQAQAHQDVPFERLVQELAVERSLSHAPLFQVMVTLDNTPRRVEQVAGLSLETLSGGGGTAKFDLTLSLSRGGRGPLFGTVEYNSDLFERATIKRLVRHYQRVLAAVVRDAEQELWQLPLLSEAEQYQLLVEWNETQQVAALGHCLHELFEQEVERSPERVAVVFGEEQLSYGELNRRANQLAHHLRRLGVGPEVLVGLCVERSVEMVVGLLGILKAGGAYVPLDPAYPEQRLAFMLEDAKVPVLLTQAHLPAAQSNAATVVLTLDREWEQVSGESAANPRVVTSAQNTAYVLYTSGSTGRPKGVMIPHGAISNHMCWIDSEFAIDEQDVVLQKTPFSFDASVWEFYAPLLTGGRLVVALPGGQRDSAYLVQAVREQQVSLLQVVPSMLGLLLSEAGLSACESLRYVFAGGEALPVELQASFTARLSGAQLCNLYGPTETTIDASFHVCEGEGSGLTVPIGRPVANDQLYLLDQQQQLVPAGVPGELYIGGAGVGRGYLGRPELTAEKFVPHPFSETGGERLYRTGDLGRHLADGSVEFLGRVDHQVKLRGYRIELGEIEAVLHSGNEVQHAVVVVQEAKQRLVGYVVRAAGSEPLTMNQWRSRLSAQLPEYMIPLIVELQEWPLLPNGKLDRRALPEPEGTLEVSGERQTARTVVEELVANIWAEVLRLDQVGINDNFFELGGHSLLATQVAARVQQVLGVQMPLHWIFKAPTVAGLAERLDGEQRAEMKPLQRRERLTMDQWHSRLSEQLPEYMVPSAMEELQAGPSLPNGKLDRRAVPEPGKTAVSSDARQTPRTLTEKLVANIWAEVLRVDQIGANDNFFELGGHSLLAAQVAARVQQVMGVQMPLRWMFEVPTVVGLAARLEGEQRAEVKPLRRRGGWHGEALPLSFAQERLWFMEQLAPGSATYNITSGVEVRGVLQLAALTQSLSEVMRRHEVLRTSFTSVAGEPVQLVADEEALAVELVDLQGLDREEQQAVARRLAREEAERPFELAHGPLLRVRLLRLGEQQHQVLFVMHHIISDGWSFGVLVREVVSLYEALVQGRPSPLAELAVQYGDYAVWQREWLQGEVLARQMAYWKQQLAGAPEVTTLPLDHPRPPQQSFRGASEEVGVGSELTAELERLSRHEGVTVFMTLVAGFASLLYRYTGQSDLLLGTTVAGRSRVEVEPLLGFFVNTLVLRTEVAGELGFSNLLAHVREVALQAQAHQDVPFERLVQELAVERSLSHAPLFQVMVTLDNTPRQVEQVAGLSLETLSGGGGGTAKFDLTLALSRGGRGPLFGTVVYNSDLFERSTIKRLVRHYQRVLAAVVRDAEQELWQLPLLSEEEQYQLLVEWNETEQVAGLGHCLHELFEQQVERSPERVAVVFGEEQLSYGELNRRANQLAHYLKGLGVGPEVLVGVCMERSVELVVGLLGILKAGGAYVPLDPAYPEQRLEFMLQDAQVAVLLTNNQQQSLPWISEPTTVLQVDLGQQWTEISRHSEAQPRSEVSSENVAYMIYTSGSTGRPKGVMISHGAISNLLFWLRTTFCFDENDVLLQKTPCSFDASVWEFYAPLLTGGRLIMAMPGGQQDSSYLVHTMSEQEVTIIHLVPSLLGMLLAENGLSTCHSLRYVFPGGEILPADMQEKFLDRLTAQLCNLYGPTETTIDSTFHICLPGGLTVPIGRPIANTQIYLLDSNLQPAPQGVPAEIYIGGAGVGRGYHNRPELTAAVFIPDPFCDASGRRLYKTGDLGRYLADGSVDFLGRVDHQVKLRGYRIELGEIEAVLRSGSEVQHAVVVVQEAEQRLVGYVVRAAASEPLTMNQWRSNLSAQLPEYMIPSVMMELQEWPLLPNGKLDRRALPEPDETVVDNGERQMARTLVEELVANIWAEVLRLDQVGVNENFFELGGHSLLAVQVAARVQQVLVVQMPLRWIFETPEVAGLAARLEGEQRAEVKPLQRREEWRGEALPLSFAQERLWFLEQLTPGSATYNIATGVEVRGMLQLAALMQSLSEVVRRHEVLRTSFIEVAGQPVQLVADEQALPVALVDLQGLDLAEQQAVARQLAREEAERPFELTLRPLLRVRLLRLGEQQHHVLFVMHHIISDGWSLGVLVREVVSLYEALVQGRPSPLAELAVQYGDYAVWQREWLQGEVLPRQVEYWKQQLAGAPEVTALPLDHARPRQQSFRGGYEEIGFGSELTAELERLSRHEGVTVFMTLVAAFASLLYRYTGQSDLLLGTTVAGRNRVEVEPLLGFFVNTLVLRTEVAGELGFSKLLAHVREVALQAQAHQDVPFERVVQELAVERSLSHAPLFQVMVTLNNTPRPVEQVAELSLEALSGGDGGTAKFDLTLALSRGGRGPLFGTVVYNSDLFERATIKRLVRHYERVLAAVVRDAEQELWQLPLLSEAEQYQLLVEWNETEQVAALGHCLHELFEQEVERSAERVAVIFGEEQLSYGELNRRANQLAHHLRRLGVGPEVLVGLCVERSIELVVGLLGILKAGGAYVPLDPAYPEQRLAFMLEDAKVPVLLTQAHLPAAQSNAATVVLALDREWEQVSGESAANPRVVTSAQNTAYVLYTSGSTGRPKGVMIPHGAIGNHMCWIQSEFAIDEQDVVLQKTPFSFDASVWEFYAPLLTGGRLVMALPGGQRDSAYLVQAVREQQVSLLQVVPSMLGLLLSEAGLSACESLRYVFAGGEALPVELHSSFAARLSGAQLCNLYGPTETTIDASFHVCEGEGSGLTVPIGRPVANDQLYLLDQQQQLVPAGVPGELYIGGAGVGRGYLGRPELTAEKFVPHPFSEAGGERLYRTGDLGRHLADGSMEFLGRVDHQVKLRGYRIELGEIEAVLREYEGVQDAVAHVQAERGESQRLVAYVVAEAGAVVNESGLQRYARQRLPEYMVPAAVVLLEELPLLPSGKLNRRALPQASLNRDESEPFVAPRTPVEQQLAEFWTELLGVEQVSIHDNFFSLGGHSLLLTQLASRIRNAMYVEVPLRRFFESPTIAEMTQIVAEHQVQQHDPEDLAQMLQELSALSSDEIQAMLAAELAG